MVKRNNLNVNSLAKSVSGEQVIICVLLVVLIVLVVYYVNQNANENFEGDKPVLYFFYVTWCPHCTNAKPEVEALEKEVKSSKLQVKKVDCDKEGELARKFGVQAYPTIVLYKKGEQISYERRVTKEGLKAFLEENL